jgi:hypothetical protein
MSNTNTGGPAFPQEYFDKQLNQGRVMHGMTLRDYFAAKALNTILGQYDFTFFEDDKSEKEDETFALIVAKNAYSMADAMMKAREA